MRDRLCENIEESLMFPRPAAARNVETRVPQKFHMRAVTGGVQGNNCLYNAFRRAILESGVVPRHRPFDYTVDNMTSEGNFPSTYQTRE